LDKSGPSAALGVPMVLYAKPEVDFSDVVIAKLNANKPAGFSSSGKASPSGTNTPVLTTKPGGFPNPNKKP
jgi:hypothetical protein